MSTAEEKRRPGRPALPDREVLKKHMLRFTDPQWERYEQAADMDDVPVAVWVRAALNRAAIRRINKG